MMMMIYLLLYQIYNTHLSIISIITHDHHGNDKDPHGIGDDDDSHNGDNGDW